MERGHRAFEYSCVYFVKASLFYFSGAPHEAFGVCCVRNALIAVYLCVGQPQEIDDADAASEAFADVFHKSEHLGAGQPEVSLASIAVRAHFDVRQQLCGVLDFVDEHRRCVALHEKRGVVFSEISYVGVVQRYIFSLRTHELLQQGSLAYLPRPGDE